MNPLAEEMEPVYKVTIEMKQRLVTLTPKEWKRIKDLTKAEEDMPYDDRPDNYAYVEQEEQIEMVTRKIFEQEMVGMNVRKVICAINNIVPDDWEHLE